MPEWYADAFGPWYTRLYAHRDAAEAESHWPGIVELARLTGRLRVLDLGCGTGRYARLLRAAGHEVMGLDFSRALLSEARRRDPLLQLARGDMRRLPFREAGFDRVLSLFTSFGYFAEDAENLAVLRGIARVLHPGGLLLLDYLNPASVKPAPWTTREQEGLTLRSRKFIAARENAVVKEVVVTEAGQTLASYAERVKLYGPSWFESAAASSGLAMESTHGHFSGHSLGPDSERAIYLFRKT